MKCLYCGGPLPLALLKKLTGAGEFCSEQCREGYQSEFNRLAVGRLQQARVTRRVPPAGGTSEFKLTTVLDALESRAAAAPPPASAEPAAVGLSAEASVPGAAAGVVNDVPPPVWVQSAIEPPQPVAIAERGTGDRGKDVPEPMFLNLDRETRLPSFGSGLDVSLEPPAREPEVETLFAALQTAVEGSAPAAAATPVLTASEPAGPAVRQPQAAPDEDAGDADWMAPRGLLAMTLRSVPVAPALRIPALVPAPIFVYLQLPESLLASSVGKTGLWWAGPAPAEMPLSGSLVLYGSTEPLRAGLNQVLRTTAPYRISMRLSPKAGFDPDGADLRFSPGAAPMPAILSNVFFGAPKPTWAGSVRANPRAYDERFTRFVNPEEREQTRERLQQIVAQKAAQRALIAEGPTVTIPVEAVQPALSLLASVSSSLLARHQQGGLTAPASSELPALPNAGFPQWPALPVADGFAPGGELPAVVPPGSPAPAGPGNGSGHGHGLAGAPPPQADGRPSGWPDNIPYPPEGAKPAADARPDAARPDAAMPDAGKPAAALAKRDAGESAPAGGGAALPGMPPIQGNVYMFGNEINAKDDDESTALVKSGRESEDLSETGPAEPEPEQPNFTRPGGGFPLSGGGTMNVGTMVVVNQPSGAVNINASSPTAATFESRLRQKGPAPLSSIAEAVGLQMPVPLAAKEMPLRMNFQGRLDAAVPVKWPGFPPGAMRKKMFLSTPKAKRADSLETIAAQNARPLPPPPMTKPPSSAASPAQEGDGGAMGWIKSFSNRFGKK